MNKRQELRELRALGHFAEQLRGAGVISGGEPRVADFLFDARHFLRQNFVVKLRRDLAPIGKRSVVLEPLPDLRAGNLAMAQAQRRACRWPQNHDAALRRTSAAGNGAHRKRSRQRAIQRWQLRPRCEIVQRNVQERGVRGVLDVAGI